MKDRWMRRLESGSATWRAMPAVVLVQGVCRRQGLAQNVTLSVPGNVVLREAETNAIRRTLGAEYFQLLHDANSAFI